MAALLALAAPPGRRLSRLAPHLAAVQAAYQARLEAWEQADAAFTEAVLEARRAQYSLAEIGDAAGISGPGVRKAIVRGLERRVALTLPAEPSRLD